MLGGDRIGRAGRDHDGALLAALRRFDAQVDFGEEGLATELAMALAGHIGRRGDRFAVADAGRMDLGVESELAQEAMLDDFEVKFSHASDERLSGLFILFGVEGRILTFEHLQDVRELLSFGGVLRFNGHRQHGVGELNTGKFDRMLRIAQRVAGDRISRSDGSHDVPCPDFRDLAILFPAGGVDLPQLSDILLLVALRVVDSGVGFERSGVDSDPVPVARLGREDLEHESAEGFLRIGAPGQFLVAVLGVDTLDRRHVARSGQVKPDGVEKGLDRDAVERRAAQDGLDLQVERRRSKHLPDQLLGDVVFTEHRFHQFIAEHGELFQQPFAVELRRRLVRFGDRFDLELATVGRIVEDEQLHSDDIDDAAERIGRVRRPFADRNQNRQRVGPQTLFDLLEHAFEVGTFPIELIDEGDSRDMVLVGLPPYGLALRFDTLARAEDDDRPVEHAEAPFDLGGEVDMPGRVEQVEMPFLPLERDARGVDRDAAFLLLGIAVGLGRALVDSADAVLGAAEKQHLLRHRRLAGVDVRDDADIAKSFQIPLHAVSLVPRETAVLGLFRRTGRSLAERIGKRRAEDSTRRPLCRIAATTQSGRTPCWLRPCDGHSRGA